MIKRGQVALFVIIAILIVSGVFAILYAQTELFKKTGANPQIAPINSFIQSCIRSTGEEALVFIGQQGGYYGLPKLSISGYSYYFYNNKSVIPSKEKIEREISRYMNEMLPFCTKNFVDFSDFNIEADPQIISKAIILADKVKFDVDYKILIKKGDTAYRLSRFSIEIPSRLSTIYSVAQGMISIQLEDPSSICLTCLTNYAINNDLYVDMANLDNNTVIFKIVDKNMPLQSQPYEFMFVNKYD